MTEAHSSAVDRELMKRLTIVVLFIFFFTAAFTRLDRVYSQKFFDVTGQAYWIWAPHRISRNEPVVFFATRDFDLPEQRLYTSIKILGDPEYTLWFNGYEIAGRRVGDERELDVYDVSKLAKTGRNRIVVAVRANQGVGGLLASVDLAPEVENWVVTDARWKIYRRWRPDILLRDSPDLGPAAPMLVGEPPIGRWNYVTSASREFAQPFERTIPPREVFTMRALLPTIRTRAGVAISVADPVRAQAFDFGFTKGRVRLTIEGDATVSRAITVRYANAREELDRVEWATRAFVFAPGERTVIDPEVESFRYVLVYGGKAAADVVQ
ncbi:MAG TPA: hypothetical protein VGF69_26015 [Thermoanaerobaculia bacterium]|jgi:hypothetical protein